MYFITMSLSRKNKLNGILHQDKFCWFVGVEGGGGLGVTEGNPFPSPLLPALHEKLPLTNFDSHQKCSQSWTTIFDTPVKGVGALLTLALTQL